MKADLGSDPPRLRDHDRKLDFDQITADRCSITCLRKEALNVTVPNTFGAMTCHCRAGSSCWRQAWDILVGDPFCQITATQYCYRPFVPSVLASCPLTFKLYNFLICFLPYIFNMCTWSRIFISTWRTLQFSARLDFPMSPSFHYPEIQGVACGASRTWTLFPSKAHTLVSSKKNWVRCHRFQLRKSWLVHLKGSPLPTVVVSPLSQIFSLQRSVFVLY